jgi:hypothetical protein
MGQHNIDKDFGQKLRDREIAPKTDSWEKLNSRLENDTKRSGSYKWIPGIAASFVAGILILGQVYRTNVAEEAPSVVETPVEVQEEKDIKENQQNSQLAVEEVEEPVKEEKLQEKQPIKNTPVPQLEAIAEIVHEAEKPSEEIAISEALEEARHENFPVKLEDAIAAVSSSLAEKDGLAEAEVDSLLMMAASRISRERTTYVAGQNVDPESLLWDVEMEMEQSFREKVFDIMKEGYLKARTAVANRNY